MRDNFRRVVVKVGTHAIANRSGRPDRAALRRIVEGLCSLRDAGCEAVVVGCTELSVIYQELSRHPKWLFDSLDILADRCVKIYETARAANGHIEM